MTEPMLPEEAVRHLIAYLDGVRWFRGAFIVGVGPHAVIEVRTDSLQHAESFIANLGGRWAGYPVRPRRATP